MSDEPGFQFFGEPWFSEPGGGWLQDSGARRVETPVGERCSHCGEPFRLGERGVIRSDGWVVHLECEMRAVLGGVNHLLGRCSCQGGELTPDPAGLSKREAAIAAYDVLCSRVSA